MTWFVASSADQTAEELGGVGHSSKDPQSAAIRFRGLLPCQTAHECRYVSLDGEVIVGFEVV